MSDITHPDTAAVLRDIATERERQVDKGWTREHDDRHNTHTLVNLAKKRAHQQGRQSEPGYYDRVRLVEAAAMLVAASLEDGSVTL